MLTVYNRGHTDFSESVEEIAPLTEAQKSARLAELREQLAAKRAASSVQDKEDKRKNEEIRKKATKESHDIREALQNKERIKEAEKKRAEKKADELARKKVLDQINQDKEDRKRKAEQEKAAREGRVLEEEAAPPPPPKKTVEAIHAEARLRLQTPSGTVTKTFPAATTLFEVAHAITEDNGFEAESFLTTFPRKTFSKTDFGMTLKEAGMTPSAAVIVK